MLDDTPDSPDWWLLRLGRKLRARQRTHEEWWRYYRGRPPLPELPKNAQQAFIDFQRKSRTNFCQLIANASVHRLFALGVTGPDGEPDDRAMSWWQRSRLDSRQKLTWRLAMARGVGYMLVGPHPKRTEDNGRPSPLITQEHPRECIVESDPETGEPYVGLKAWHDDIDGYGYARVMFDDVDFSYRTRERCSGRRLPWGPDSWVWEGDEDGEPHDLGMMRLVEFGRMPDLGEDPEPEFAGVMDIQDRVNMGVLNRMTASRYSAFRQKYVTGHKFAKKTDPATGLVTVEQPFVPSPSAIWASEAKEASFGQLDATDLSGFLKEHQSDVRDMLILSQTPAYYYAGDIINIGADTVSALDILHVAKMREHIAAFGEGLETVLALAAAQAGVPEDYTEAEVRWANPAHISLAVKADAATKLKSIGYPLDVVAEEMGETPARVKRITAGAAAQALLSASLLPAPAGAPTAGNVPDDAGPLDG
ncbi:phage portal protein [Streptomyces sp. NRRL F-5135]|uniref:phage portal protein n=1 Tax=Streptomyces sp. NRRL F-5135 TaxID=1463858 RepID=UPI0004C4B7A8|nr:phage portal protein [Streptomyces sp. NRRL F-5135]